MSLFNCEHPNKIYNKYIKESMYVPCGKCAACRSHRAYKWVTRLQAEQKCHAYTQFAFLSYDNAHLPKYRLGYNALEKSSYLYDERYYPSPDASVLEWDEFYHHVIPYHELKFDGKADWQYFEDRQNDELYLPYGDVRDLQLFLKRLNKRIHDEITHTYQNFRYFIVCEYGPTTFRPHYHGLFYIDNSEVNKQFKQLLSVCWQNGDTNTQPVQSTAASYVAQYLNCFTYLPSIYSHPRLRPFHIFSKHPSIGSLYESDAEVREIFDSSSPVRVVCDADKGKDSVSLVPILPSLENRLYPKCPRYSSLPYIDRVALYGLAHIFNSQYSEDFDEWCRVLSEIIVPRQDIYAADNPFEFLGSVQALDVTEGYVNLYHHILEMTEGFNNIAPLRTIFRVSNRVVAQCRIWNVSLFYYVKQIDKYYANKSYLQLRNFYAEQESALNDGTIILDDVVWLYPRLSEYVTLHCNQTINDCPAYQSFVAKFAKIDADNTKTARKNAYFESLRFKQNNPKLYNLISSYYAKKCNEDGQTVSKTWQECL